MNVVTIRNSPVIIALLYRLAANSAKLSGQKNLVAGIFLIVTNVA